MDYNLIENVIRALVLERKNYLFEGNHDAAVMCSLMAGCKAEDVNLTRWLSDVLSRIPYYQADYSKDLAELFPHQW